MAALGFRCPGLWLEPGPGFTLRLAALASNDHRPPTADRRSNFNASRLSAQPPLGTLPRFTLHPSPPPRLLASSSPRLALTYFLLARYFSTDQQFGPPDDAYTQALNTAVIQASPADQIVTVAPYHYHVPMNRFKARLPITGLAQQVWPLPETTLSLLKNSATGQNIWLVTVGFSPAASDNAAEQWLTFNAFSASNDWFDDVRLVRFGAQSPTVTRPINATFGQEVRLVEVKVIESLQPGQTLPVEFVWQSLQRPQADYNLFLQLLTTAGTLIAQHDSQPNGGYTPTSTWLPRPANCEPSRSDPATQSTQPALIDSSPV